MQGLTYEERGYYKIPKVVEKGSPKITNELSHEGYVQNMN